MGEQFTDSKFEAQQLRNFTRCLLDDIHALEKMHREGMIESGVRRIGAEQELVLVDSQYRPAPVALEVLDRLNDPTFTTEVARFNLEFNLDPQVFGGDCLSRLEDDLNTNYYKVKEAAKEFNTSPVLIGILPTTRLSDLHLGNMTPRERYFALNDALNRLRGGDFELNLKGTDELMFKHDNVMIEAFNTSFQVHFQVSPDEFARRYNIAQAVAGPILAASVNSPLIGSKRLWSETRIAIFEQSLDTRSASYHRELPPRVHFGKKWVNSSVLELFQEDIGRYKVLFAIDIDENPHEAISEGRAPSLQALRLHNGTVYRWNRACYGISDGKPHLRIENRIFPAGPTVLDEVANAAFWFGLMSGVAEAYKDVTEKMEFDTAKDNFFSAARYGLGAQFTWFNDKRMTASRLITEELIPLAREGLIASKIDSADIDKYMGVVEERVKKDQTGAYWLVKSLKNMKHQGTHGEQLNALVAGTINRQDSGKPVHTWSYANLEEAGGWEKNYLRIGQFMVSDMITVRPDEPIDLVANLMVWNSIRHVLIEDDHHNLVGLISHRSLLRLVGREFPQEDGQSAPVSSFMISNPITVEPDTLTTDAIRLMREKRIACLPVVKDSRLVGVVTEDHFMNITSNLLEKMLPDKKE